jgi:DNA-binding SARP family transcriptional activator/WD40 repeat protein
VEFRILGPFEVVHRGGSLALGSTQQRAVLALLLLHRSEVLSTDRLIDELWGERAPATAVKAVQGYVSHLRKALGEGVIATHGRGYVLTVEPEQMDVGRFEVLASEGRRALAEGDAVRAGQRLEAALGLWRGEPLADFAYEPFAQDEIARLREARLLAREDRIDADLALGRDAELIPEIERLMAANQLRERLRGQLMISLYRSGRQADALAVYRQTSELLQAELGLHPGPALKKLERMILEQDEALDAVPMLPTQPAAAEPVVCPFKGLAFFDRADAEYYCGRERVVSELVARLAESTLVGILGPSGIGKSSLLRAGVLAALRAGVLPGSAEWRQVLLRPGKHPSAELGRAVGDRGLREEVARLAPGNRIVIAVDQLEELFTVCEREDERAEFLDQVGAVCHDAERRALVVCSLRADFYGRVGSYPRFAELLSRSHVLLGPMGPDELARAIEQPASRAGLEVERALIAALVSEVSGERGGLPLLSTTLLELWWASDGHTLRLERYRATGGVRGAVARLAEDAYRHLGRPEQLVARGVMLRLVSGDDETLVRRRIPFADLDRVDGAAPVVAALIEARLLTVSDGEVELSHEALVREWPRYREWLVEDRIGRRLHSHLSTAAREWEARDRDPGELYRGARLAGAVEWRASHRDQLNSLELDFIASSQRRAGRQARRLRLVLAGVVLLLLLSLLAGGIALIQKQHTAGEARVALAGELGAEAVNQPRIDLAMLLAREAVNLDRSPQTEGTLLATLLRSPAVFGTFPGPSNSAPLLALSPDGRTLAATWGYYPKVHFYDPRTHAVQRRPLTDFGGGGSEQPPAYSSGGSLLAYRAQQGYIAVRSAHTLALRYKLAFDQKWVSHQNLVGDDDIQIARDQRTVYYAYSIYDAAGNPRAAYLDRWLLPSGQPASTVRIGSGNFLALRLTDAGDHVVAATTGGVRIFDAHSLRLVRSLTARLAPARQSAAAISPDGRAIVIGSQNGSVSFVDLSTGKVRRGVGGHSAVVTTLVYSPQGHTVITVGEDDKVIIWNPATATPAEVLTGHTGQVQSAAISPDGTTLYTSSLDDVLAWDLAGDRRFGRRFRFGGAPPCCDPVSPAAPPLALSPDGSRFAVALGGSTIGLFSVQTLQRQSEFVIRPGNKVITALAWSPAGSELAVAGHSGVVQVWNVDGPPRLVRALVGLHSVLGQPEAIQAVAFSYDGALVAASDMNQTPAGPGINPGFIANLAIWQAGTGTLVAPPRDLGIGGGSLLAFSHTGKLLAVSLPDASDVLVLDASTGRGRRTLAPGDVVGALAFAPDARLAIGTASGTVQFWNPDTGKQTVPSLSVASSSVANVAFDPTGERFATTGYRNGAVKLWSTATLKQEGTPLNTDQGATSTIAFGPGGRSVLAIDDRGNGFSWPTSLAAWQQHACAVAARNLTRTEWARFITGHRYGRVCP